MNSSTAIRCHANWLIVAGLAALMSFAPATQALAADDAGWKAGAAKVPITPEKLMWMSGYAGRDHAAEGKLHDLWAKALVLEDAAGKRAVLVTLDLVGIDRTFALAVRDELEKRYKFDRSQIALCCSHTHTGPVVGRNLRAMYFLDDQQSKLVDEYTDGLERKIVAVVGEAVEKLKPAQLTWGTGRATFAVNRRNNVEADVPKLMEDGALRGPVDHDVPVLAVHDATDKLVAVACGYACHATVLSFYQWSGDYAGFAQIDVEAIHPGAVALFWAGCGGDQNPLPRREVALAKKYGLALAEAIERVLINEMSPIAGRLETSYAEIDLPLDRLPTRDELTTQSQSSNKYEAARAKMLLAQIDGGRPLSPAYPYPVEVWRLGDGPIWVTLGGEVVVDYSLRIKSELVPGRTWVAGYTNDVMAYIPSRRVLAEGGYEGGGAMLYYGLPTVWSPAVEETILREVHRQVGDSVK
ncbi:MAG: neutral/alkaline non-lysosomal ceramidase N-terminal domain-containing protein [Planctomycetia bacterium]|nr:neutral/alkaline non-lysosomal ceramidase N-terminal domain-containing protein [Planctomycetia bacterium]